MIENILFILFCLGIIGIIIGYMAWNRTGPPQSTDELLDRADKAIRETSARIAAEGRENIRGIRRVM